MRLGKVGVGVRQLCLCLLKLSGKVFARDVQAKLLSGVLRLRSVQCSGGLIAVVVISLLLGKNPLDEMCMATPAISRGSLIIRTASKLYRIAKTE